MTNGDTLPLTSQRLIALEDIKQLKARYCRSVDHKRWDEFRSVFAPDCDFSGTAEAASGVDEFVAGVKRSMGPLTSVHQVFNPEIIFLDDDRAKGSWAQQDFLQWDTDAEIVDFLRGSPEQTGLFGFGFYEEEYRCVGGRWLISRIRVGRQALLPLFPTEGTGPRKAWGAPDHSWIVSSPDGDLG